MSVQRGQFTYAGAQDNAFSEYARAMAGVATARNSPLIYRGAPDHSGVPGSAPYFGTVGVFDSHGAVNTPIGYFAGNYGGDTPITIQPTIRSPEPWDSPELT